MKKMVIIFIFLLTAAAMAASEPGTDGGQDIQEEDLDEHQRGRCEILLIRRTATRNQLPVPMQCADDLQHRETSHEDRAHQLRRKQQLTFPTLTCQ